MPDYESPSELQKRFGCFGCGGCLLPTGLALLATFGLIIHHFF